ncbi:MAG: hypothetical protein WC846_05410 [Candidatus Gracilibacteria bacterium]|jgi:Skp family chaperone for outer membrane proteins
MTKFLHALFLTLALTQLSACTKIDTAVNNAVTGLSTAKDEAVDAAQNLQEEAARVGNELNDAKENIETKVDQINAATDSTLRAVNDIKKVVE